MPKVTIDGEEIEVQEGTSILEAALSRGNEVPHYCYHPRLSIAGNCRMCLVEVEKAPKLAIACATPVAEGMVVNTRNARVKEAQNAVMEFLLINHPLDCPICDQAGECKLQDNAVAHGTGVSRYTEPKLALAKAVDIGRHVMLDQERCIQCSRCIRFCDEITGTSELAFFQRGERAQIGIYPGRHLDNPYSGNTVDLCPVGALTLKEFRFRTRVWYLKNTPSICAGCSRGCNVMVAVGRKQEMMTSPGQLDDRIKRIVPRNNVRVNGYWMCDEGRMSYERREAAPRLVRAQQPAGTDADWDAAVRNSADRLKAAAAKGRAAAIVSPRLPTETLWALRELFLGLGDVRVGVRRLTRGEDDALLIRADKGANSQGAAWVFGEAADEDSVLDAVSAGEVDALVVTGDPLDPEDTAQLSADARDKLNDLIYVGPFVDATAEHATLALPSAAWAEESGTFVNFEGRIQRVDRAHRPRGDTRPGWRVAAELAIAVGQDTPPWQTSADVLEAMAESLEPYAGLTENEIGLLGVRRDAPATAGA
jgi:NADH-quinone oxidoreductase subunit G